jgi:hypothetical protein
MYRRPRVVHPVAVLGGIARAIFGTAGIPVHAAMPSWNGKYSLVRYAVDKNGSSAAAGQAEPTFRADYVFVTSCSSGKCVATATDGPTPKNPTLPQPSHWDGSRWVEHFDFQWDCYMGGFQKCGPLRGRGLSARLNLTGRCAVPGTPTSRAARAAEASKCRWRRLLLALDDGGRPQTPAEARKPDETYCDTVTDAYLFAAHWSQEPQQSLSSHGPAADVNATSRPPKGVTFVGDSSKHFAMGGVDGRCRIHRCVRSGAISECHALQRARSKRGSPGCAACNTRATAGRGTANWPPAYSYE